MRPLQKVLSKGLFFLYRLKENLTKFAT